MERNSPELEQMHSKDQEPSSIASIEGFLKNIVPGDPWCKIEENTLIISGVKAFIRNIRREGFFVSDCLEKDPRFKNITRPITTSEFSIFAELTEPVDGIDRVEVHIDKDM